MKIVPSERLRRIPPTRGADYAACGQNALGIYAEPRRSLAALPVGGGGGRKRRWARKRLSIPTPKDAR